MKNILFAFLTLAFIGGVVYYTYYSSKDCCKEVASCCIANALCCAK